MGITIEAMKMIRGEATLAGGSRTKEMVLFGLFTALIAIGAFIKISVPVCPFTLQLLFTTLAGLYVLLGLAGVPVFTEGGGPSYIFQPTFGYLIGFIAGAWLTGWISERRGDFSFGKTLFANLAGLLVVYLFGMVYVYIINNFYLGMPIGVWPVVLYCFVLAVPGDICLCILAAMLASRLKRAIGK